MRRIGMRRAGFSLCLALATTACGTAASGGAGPAGGPSPASAAELEAIYRARADSARMRFTEADVRFMTRMIAHHGQALEMARLAPDRTASPEVRTLAARIVNAQTDEIATMRQWLRDRGQPEPPEDPAAHGADHPADMPGMIDAERMRALEQARGPAFDRLFLTLMIQHHRGAVAMVHELFATDGAAQDEEAFKFASDAQVDQATEVARMELMLRALPGGGRSP